MLASVGILDRWPGKVTTHLRVDKGNSKSKSKSKIKVVSVSAI